MYKSTEKILNSTNWVDGNGEINSVSNLDKDHLHNILNFIYNHRDKYWLNCKKTVIIESFKDGDEFFQRVIRKSILWNSIIEQLNSKDDEFDFDWDLGSRYDH